MITIPHAGAHGRLITHEGWINAVAALAMARVAQDDAACKALHGLRLAYGSCGGAYGVTYYDKWQHGPDRKAPFVEMSAFNQSSLAQLAHTTVHEVGHVLAGFKAGHGPEWKAACARLGLRAARATGKVAEWAVFEPGLRDAILQLPAPTDGQPVKALYGASATPGASPVRPPKPCGSAKGSKGGTSYGANRWKLWTCECEPPFKVRAARVIDATCNCCEGRFTCS